MFLRCFSCLVDLCNKEFDQRSIFTKADWDDPLFTEDKVGMTPEAIGNIVIQQTGILTEEAQHDILCDYDSDSIT